MQSARIKERAFPARRRGCIDSPAKRFSVPDETIVSYWNERAVSYSCGVREELAGDPLRVWEAVLESRSHAARAAARARGDVPRVLDLGCGPGFFSIAFARLGCRVDAVDSSANMLARARENARDAGVEQHVALHEGDVSCLAFADDAFDVVALRNVTWLMRDLRSAYEEWRRVLVPGGTLLVFDANWYRYLDDPSIDARRLADQQTKDVLGQDEGGFATADQERRCEEIARALPSTYLDRPSWDLDVLRDLSFSSVSADETAWQTLWTAGEQAFYGSSPLFMIEATK